MNPDSPSTRPHRRALARTRVLSRREIAPQVHVLGLERHAEFKPGQVVAVTRSPDLPPRLYSIASGVSEPALEILFDRKPGGELTPWLAGLEPGDAVWISTPFGEFIGEADPAWWIAAGTGIAPFVSMLRSGLAPGKTLLHGARSPAGFHFQDEFAAALGDHYIRCCSGGTGPGLYNGRLTVWLAGQPALPDNVRFMLCGSSEMVVAVRERLLEKRVAYDNVSAEIYF
jgi:ferredoxin--NADP+ reductase